MGLLDDAIREHLDLKRRRGADPGEVARLEHEALGPIDNGAHEQGAAPDGEAGAYAPPAGEPPAPTGGQAAETPLAQRETESAKPLEQPTQLIDLGDLEEGAEPPSPARDHDDDWLEDTTEHDVAPSGEDADGPPSGDATHAPASAEPDAGDSAEPDAGDGAESDAADSPEADLVPADEEPAEDDVLEETPDFLQETPEHDRLWFEQKPPRDFDF